VNILIRQEAGHDLFSSVPWSADVVLRGLPIERTAGQIRIVPLFNPNMYSDVCLITNKCTDRDEFMAWSYIIQLLDLSMNIWDVERYGGLRNNKQRAQLDAKGQAFDSFAGRCVTVIIPKLVRSNAEEDENMDLDAISLEDSRRHFGYFGFGGDEGDIGTAPERNRLQALLSGLRNNTAEAIHRSDEAAEKAAMGVVTGIGSPGQGGCCDGGWCCSLVSLWLSSCYSICCGCCCCCGDDDDVIEVDTNKAWTPTPTSAGNSAPTSNTMSANRFSYMSPFEARFAALYGPALTSLEKNFRDDTGQRVGQGMLLLGWGREDTDKTNLLFGARTAAQITGTATSGVEMLKMVRDLEGGQAVSVPWKPGFPCYEWPCIKSLHSTAVSADVLAMRLQKHAQAADTMHRYMADGDFVEDGYRDCCHDGNASYGNHQSSNGQPGEGLAMHKAALPRDALLMAVEAFNGITDGNVSTDDVGLPYTLVRDASGHATGFQAKTGYPVPLDSAFGKSFVSLLAVLPPRTLLSQLTDGTGAESDMRISFQWTRDVGCACPRCCGCEGCCSSCCFADGRGFCSDDVWGVEPVMQLTREDLVLACLKDQVFREFHTVDNQHQNVDLSADGSARERNAQAGACVSCTKPPPMLSIISAEHCPLTEQAVDAVLEKPEELVAAGVLLVGAIKTHASAVYWSCFPWVGPFVAFTSCCGGCGKRGTRARRRRKMIRLAAKVRQATIRHAAERAEDTGVEADSVSARSVTAWHKVSMKLWSAPTLTELLGVDMHDQAFVSFSESALNTSSEQERGCCGCLCDWLICANAIDCWLLHCWDNITICSDFCGCLVALCGLFTCLFTWPCHWWRSEHRWHHFEAGRAKFNEMRYSHEAGLNEAAANGAHFGSPKTVRKAPTQEHRQEVGEQYQREYVRGNIEKQTMTEPDGI
jgi:hypothetical protein